MTKISDASLVAAPTGTMQMPTGEVGDLAINVEQIKTYIFTGSGGNAVTQNLIFAGPATGPATAPTFRVLVADDLPNDSGAYWKTSSGGTLSGANTITGTTTNTVKYIFNSLSVTQVDGAGLWLANTTSAGSGSQQISPSLVLEGQGWKTNATAGSQSVKFSFDVLPVQGTSAPTGSLRIRSSINNGAYTDMVTISSATRRVAIALSSSEDASVGACYMKGTSDNSAFFGGTSIASYTFFSGDNLAGNAAFLRLYGRSTTTERGFDLQGGTEINDTVGFLTSGDYHSNIIGVAMQSTNVNNVNGGDVRINGGAKATAGTADGNVVLANLRGSVMFNASTKSANTGSGVLILGNAGTNATGAQTNGIVIHSKDSSDGSVNATLAFYTEQAPEATATFTQTHRIKIWWNNVEYWMSLDAV